MEEPSKSNVFVEHTLRYPEHLFSPDDLLHFVYADEFVDDWSNLGLNDESDLWALETMIMLRPTTPPVISGTGGLRKIRFARKGVGKSGGIRVCYVFFPDDGIVLMMMAYAKNVQDNLSLREKAGIAEYISTIRRWLASR